MSKPNIIVVGCGEHARMTIDNIEESAQYTIAGLTTHLDEELNTQIYGYPVLCKDDDIPSLIESQKNIVGYILGVGHMSSRRRIFTSLDVLLEPVNVIHPQAIVSKHAQIGRGNLIEAFTKIANGAVLGDHCIINSFSAVNHDQVIGDNVLIAGNVSMAGKSIGSDTIIADGASIGFKKSVGCRCIIGDGAVVTKDIPDDMVAYGNPAKVVRKNEF